MTYRRWAAIAASFAGWIAGTSVALADASFDPSTDGGVAGTSDAPILPIAIAVIVGAALILLFRARGPGAVLGLVFTLAGLAFGLLSIGAGLFGDFSGRHEIFPIPIAIGIVVIALVLFALWRGGRRSQALDR